MDISVVSNFENIQKLNSIVWSCAMNYDKITTSDVMRIYCYTFFRNLQDSWQGRESKDVYI